jgi:N-acetylmuramoyl-L-alanine amidase
MSAEQAKPDFDGGTYVTVRQGDCTESIAFENGLFWETIWNDGRNAELKNERQSPNELLPGDRIFVPDKRKGEVSCATEQKHRFRRKGVPSKLKLVVQVDGEPIAKTPYVIQVDGKTSDGTTDDKGRIELPIVPNARRAKLRVGEGEDAIEYQLQLGHVDPIESLSGVQERLTNLGFACHGAGGILDEPTVAALEAFQAREGLEVTGEPDDTTREALVRLHGS